MDFRLSNLGFPPMWFSVFIIIFVLWDTLSPEILKLFFNYKIVHYFQNWGALYLNSRCNHYFAPGFEINKFKVQIVAQQYGENRFKGFITIGRMWFYSAFRCACTNMCWATLQSVCILSPLKLCMQPCFYHSNRFCFFKIL